MSSATVVLLAGLASGGAVLVWPAGAAPVWTPAPRLWHSLRGDHLGRSRRGSGGGHAGPAPGSTRGLVPEALELVALALLGGGSLPDAVTRVGELLPGTHGRQLTAVGDRLHEGAPEEEAWDDAGKHWAPARRSLQLAQAAGVAPGQALTRAAQDLRRDAVADVEVAAARLGVRLVLPLGLAYLPAFVLTTVLPVVLALTRGLAW